MSRLTTVATFDLPPKAQLARLVLEEAGIPAVVTDEGIVAMEWVLSNAVGGIKVQVARQDADRAAAVLADRLGGAGSPGEVDEDELTRQALAEPAEDGGDGETAEAAGPAPHRATADAPGPDGREYPAAPPERTREETARRALFAVLLSGLCPPIALYAAYLWFQAAFGPGPLTRWGRAQVAASGLMVFFYLTPVWVVGVVALLALRAGLE